MADDRDQGKQGNQGKQGKQGSPGGQGGTGASHDRTIGEGMNSPDSTQMPLKASTGEPDYDTQSGRGGTSQNAGGSQDGGSSSR